MAQLKDMVCVPCRGGIPPLGEVDIQNLKPQVPDWEVVEDNNVKKLWRLFKVKDFRQALDLTNQVGAAAEEQDHHPTILVEWGKVTVTWWTHKIKGLHQNDFIMAARTDDIYQRLLQEETE